MNRVVEIFIEFFRLGLTSFGGPSAHIAYFRTRFVEQKQWIDESEYASILALTQFLPGPGSSQMGMAIGWKRGGAIGSVAAFLGFTLPSAVIMILFAHGVMKFSSPEDGQSGWIRGLQIAVIVVIANAVWSMAKSLCQGKIRALIALIAAGVVLAVASNWDQIGVILGGGLLGWLLLRDEVQNHPPEDQAKIARGPSWFSILCLLLFAAILIATPWMSQTGGPLVQGFSAMYKSGALVFGGGHVVLPLLSQEVVDTGWMSDARFSAGYGAAQAVPGPLFTISSYLGALLKSDAGPWLSALVCTLGIFLPGWLLTLGTLPFWERLKNVSALRQALAGTNAAVVGLLGAALYDPVWTKAIFDSGDVVFLIGVIAVFKILKWPAWAVVIVSGLAGGFVFR